MLRSCFHDAVTTCLLTIDVDLLHRVVPAARRGEVEVSDLPLPSNQQAEPAFEEFDKNWNEAVAAGNPKLMKVNVQRLADGLPALRWWTFGTACALLQPSKKLDLVVAPVADSFAIVSLMFHCDFIRCGRMFLGNAAPLAICLYCSTVCPLSQPCMFSSQVLTKTYGRDVFRAGVFKLLWSVFVIMGGALHNLRRGVLYLAGTYRRCFVDADARPCVLHHLPRRISLSVHCEYGITVQQAATASGRH